MATIFRHPSRYPQDRSSNKLLILSAVAALSFTLRIPAMRLAVNWATKNAMERILTIRKIDQKHHLTLMCADLSELGTYAKVDNAQFRQLKAATPGSYTFILQATKEVPNRTLHPKRKTIGLRVPDNATALALLQELGEPILSCTLMLPEDEEPLTDPYEIRDRLEHAVDLVIDGGWCGTEPTTVIDMTDGTELIRQGKGDIAVFGL